MQHHCWNVYLMLLAFPWSRKLEIHATDWYKWGHWRDIGISCHHHASLRIPTLRDFLKGKIMGRFHVRCRLGHGSLLLKEWWWEIWRKCDCPPDSIWQIFWQYRNSTHQHGDLSKVVNASGEFTGENGVDSDIRRIHYQSGCNVCKEAMRIIPMHNGNWVMSLFGALGAHNDRKRLNGFRSLLCMESHAQFDLGVCYL